MSDPVTADDLTEAQIREFNIALGKAMESASSAEWRRLADLRDECAFALGYRFLRKGYKREASERVAAAINATRTKETP